MKNCICVLFFMFISITTFAQINCLSGSFIPEDLNENANSIIKDEQIGIQIVSKTKMIIKKKRVILVNNELGLRNIDAIEFYDKSNKINSIEAIHYDNFGNEIKKYRRKDFSDQSVADGFSIFSDDRLLNLNFTPIQYPFTIVFTSEIETNNTAFIPTWSPVSNFNESVVNSSITIEYPDYLGFKYKEKNIDNNNIIKKVGVNNITFQATNIPAFKREDYSPGLRNISPSVLFGLEQFSLVGVEGVATTWEEFGIWMQQNLLDGLDEISLETQDKIRALVGSETDPIKKAKIVYQYVQNKTRYVSIQLGIGGWKPMPAMDVDRLGYGDCKALTNYTRVLLKAVNVPSYYTVIYGDAQKINFQEDFVSMQGNHIILSLPINDKLYFLECTSQTTPFGFQGNFTDDRYALIVKPTGGEIIKTNTYLEKDTAQIINGSYSINESGALSGSLSIKSTGIQYDSKYSLESNSHEERIDRLKAEFRSINNLKIENFTLNNNKETIEFTENISLSAMGYGTVNLNQIIFPFNAFNHNSIIPQRYRNRKFPMEITRGYYDVDSVTIAIPNNYSIEVVPANIEIKEKFGMYSLEIIKNNNSITYKRSLLIYKGLYEKTDYELYRKFREQIAKIDNSKIIITKTP